MDGDVLHICHVGDVRATTCRKESSSGLRTITLGCGETCDDWLADAGAGPLPSPKEVRSHVVSGSQGNRGSSRI